MRKNLFSAVFLMAALSLSLFFTSCKIEEIVSDCTITFLTEHGEKPGPLVVPQKTVLDATQLPVLKDNDWVFNGWYDGNTYVTPGEYVVTHDVTFIARWTSNNGTIDSIQYSTPVGTLPDGLRKLKKGDVLTEDDLPDLSDGIHVFEGWYVNDTDEKLEPGYKLRKAIIITARWKQVSVFLYRTKDSDAFDEIKVYVGDSISKDEIYGYEVAGYKFDGFALSKNGSAFDCSGFYPSEDTSLYGKWSVRYYSVVFDSNNENAQGTMSKMTISYNQSYTLSYNRYTLTGYSFSGWNTASDGSGTSYEDKETFTAAAQDITLYAQWIPKDYTITFNPNGGDGESYSQTFTYGVSQKLEKNRFTKTGYAFNGWNTKQDGKGTSFSDEASYTIGSSNCNFYAIWVEADRYSITYMNIKDVSNSSPESYRASEGITLKNPSSVAGYNFDGWCLNCDENGNGTGEVITGWGPAEKEGDITLYGKWSPKTDTRYKVEQWIQNTDDDEYTLNSSQYNYGTTDAYTEVVASSKGKHFIPKTIEQKKINADGSTVICVYYDRNVYTYTFDLNNGSEPIVKTAKYYSTITMENPVYEGVIFTGWTLSSSSMPTKETTFAHVDSDRTYTANWIKKIGVEVTIVQNTDDVTVSQTVNDGFITLKVPEEYTVNFWRFDEVLQSSKENTLTIDTSELLPGIYSVYVRAVKDKKNYSVQINVEVK